MRIVKKKSPQVSTKPAKLKIHTWPERILRTKCKKVNTVDALIQSLLEEMLVLMRLHGGVGLAANQAGLDLQLLIVEAEDRTFKLINPAIIKRDGSICFNEGCLSFPGLELNVERADKVWISALDEKGDKVDFEIEGVLAVIFQHEIDHINGITFIDRVSFWQRLKNSGKLKEIARRTKNGLPKQKEKS